MKYKSAIIKALFFASFGMCLSLFVSTETKAAGTEYTLSVTTNISDVAGYGNSVTDITCQAGATSPHFSYTTFYNSSWCTSSFDLVNDSVFGEGTYCVRFFLDVSSANFSNDDTFVINVDGTNYQSDYDQGNGSSSRRITFYVPVTITAPPSITTTSLPNGTVGEAYSQQLQASGGSDALSWEITSGTIPHFSLSSSGVLSGTPDSVGEYPFTVKVTDALDRSDMKNLTITFYPAAVTHTVTYHVLNGKWNNNSTADRTETVENGQHPREIPPVGSKPNSGYKAGSWDTNPSTATITGNSNFTYTYVSDTPSSSSKKSDDSDHYESSPAPAPKPVNPNAIISTSFSFNGAAVNSSFGKGVIKIGPQEQGTAAQLAFRLNTPAGWREAFSFNMTVNNKTTYDPKTGTLSFTIPTRYQKDGRKFAILGIDQDGKVKIFYDTDATADTITVNLIDFPGYAFDLIYVD